MFVLMFQALGERMLLIIKENEAIMTEVDIVSPLPLQSPHLAALISIKFK